MRLITYFDTSAFVPLVMDEPSSDSCRELWTRSEKVVSTRLLFVETSAAIAKANRMGRVGQSTVVAGLDDLAHYWREIAVTEFELDLMLGATAMAHRFGLRGSDAIHCAAALRINDEEVVAASGDQRLLDAWTELGMNTFDANA